jgi:hypothetical protein
LDAKLIRFLEQRSDILSRLYKNHPLELQNHGKNLKSLRNLCLALDVQGSGLCS